MYVDSEGQVVGTFEATQHNPVMDTRTDLGSPPPWYNFSLLLGTTTKSPAMTDNPRFEVPHWSPDLVGQPRETDGSESFTTYLVAMRGTANPIYLGNLSWSMNWRGRFSGGAFHGQAASLGATNRNTTGNAMLGGGAANNHGTARYTPAPAAAPATPAAASSTGRDTNHHLGTHAGAYGGGLLGAVKDATASAKASAEKKEAEDAKPTPGKIEK